VRVSNQLIEIPLARARQPSAWLAVLPARVVKFGNLHNPRITGRWILS